MISKIPVESLEPRRHLSAQWLGDISHQGVEPTQLVSNGTTLFFSGRNSAYGRELWKSDGTPAGTRMVIDLAAGRVDSNPSSFFVAGRFVLFTAKDAKGTLRLYRSDGSAKRTVALRTLRSSDDFRKPAYLGNDRAVFQLRDSDGTAALYRTDASSTLMRIAKDTQWFGVIVASPAIGRMAALNAKGLFTSDGTVEGTSVIAFAESSSLHATSQAIYATTVTGDSSSYTRKIDLVLPHGRIKTVKSFQGLDTYFLSDPDSASLWVRNGGWTEPESSLRIEGERVYDVGKAFSLSGSEYVFGNTLIRMVNGTIERLDLTSKSFVPYATFDKIAVEMPVASFSSFVFGTGSLGGIERVDIRNGKSKLFSTAGGEEPQLHRVEDRIVYVDKTEVGDTELFWIDRTSQWPKQLSFERGIDPNGTIWAMVAVPEGLVVATSGLFNGGIPVLNIDLIDHSGKVTHFAGYPGSSLEEMTANGSIISVRVLIGGTSRQLLLINSASNEVKGIYSMPDEVYRLREGSKTYLSSLGKTWLIDGWNVRENVSTPGDLPLAIAGDHVYSRLGTDKLVRFNWNTLEGQQYASITTSSFIYSAVATDYGVFFAADTSMYFSDGTVTRRLTTPALSNWRLSEDRQWVYGMAGAQLFRISANPGSNTQFERVYQLGDPSNALWNVAWAQGNDVVLTSPFHLYPTETYNVRLISGGVQIGGSYSDIAKLVPTPSGLLFQSPTKGVVTFRRGNVSVLSIPTPAVIGADPTGMVFAETLPEGGHRLQRYRLDTFISGNLYNDLDADMARDSGERGLMGWRVYVDRNDNGRYDKGENSTFTDAGGNFEFFELDPGTHKLRISTGANYQMTTGTVYTVKLVAGTNVRKKFGARAIG